MLLHLTKESDGQTSKPPIHSQPAITCDYTFTAHDEPRGNESSQLCVSEFTDHGKNSKFDVEIELPIMRYADLERNSFNFTHMK